VLVTHSARKPCSSLGGESRYSWFGI